MKKIFYLFGVLVFGFGVSACGKTDATDTSGGTTSKPAEGIVYPDLDGEKFIVMCDDASKADPRGANYQRMYKKEKIEKIDAVQKNYNVEVVFETYPGGASWGGARERWIAERSALGEKPAMIFELASYQTGKLVATNSILQIDDLIEKYGVKGYWEEKKQYGQFLGKTYSYDDAYPIADEGIYYNIDLLADHGYVEKPDFSGNTPAELWLNGKWDWAAFEKMVVALNLVLDETDANNPQYPIGGRTYNWAYQFMGANGGNLVEPTLNVTLDSNQNIETLNFMNSIYSQPGMWRDESPMSNAAEPEFLNGNIAMHNGQSYWLFQQNKWLNKTFNVGFVPYPKGPNILEDESNYYINDVSGKVVYVISSSFKKNPDNPYADSEFHEESIFRIWNDLQHFPEIDPETGQLSAKEVKDEFEFLRLEPFYNNKSSIAAHLSIVSRNYPDLFFASSNSNNHVDSSYMIKIQSAVRVGDARGTIAAIRDAIQKDFEDIFQIKPKA